MEREAAKGEERTLNIGVNPGISLQNEKNRKYAIDQFSALNLNHLAYNVCMPQHGMQYIPAKNNQCISSKP